METAEANCSPVRSALPLFFFFNLRSQIKGREGWGWGGADRQSCCVIPPPPPPPPVASHQQRPAAASADDYLLQSNRLISKSSRAQRRYQAAASAAVHSGKVTARCSGWLGKQCSGCVGGGFSGLGAESLGRGRDQCVGVWGQWDNEQNSHFKLGSRSSSSSSSTLH